MALCAVLSLGCEVQTEHRAVGPDKRIAEFGLELDALRAYPIGPHDEHAGYQPVHSGHEALMLFFDVALPQDEALSVLGLPTPRLRVGTPDDELELVGAWGHRSAIFSLEDVALPTSAMGDLTLFLGEDVALEVDDYLYFAIPGDANLDGQFTSDDVVLTQTAGLYETGEAAQWHEGDFDGDARYTSNDLVTALAEGHYEDGEQVAPTGDDDAPDDLKSVGAPGTPCGVRCWIEGQVESVVEGPMENDVDAACGRFEYTSDSPGGHLSGLCETWERTQYWGHRPLGARAGSLSLQTDCTATAHPQLRCEPIPGDVCPEGPRCRYEGSSDFHGGASGQLETANYEFTPTSSARLRARSQVPVWEASGRGVGVELDDTIMAAREDDQPGGCLEALVGQLEGGWECKQTAWLGHWPECKLVVRQLVDFETLGQVAKCLFAEGEAAASSGYVYSPQTAVQEQRLGNTIYVDPRNGVALGPMTAPQGWAPIDLGELRAETHLLFELNSGSGDNDTVWGDPDLFGSTADASAHASATITFRPANDAVDNDPETGEPLLACERGPTRKRNTGGDGVNYHTFSGGTATAQCPAPVSQEFSCEGKRRGYYCRPNPLINIPVHCDGEGNEAPSDCGGAGPACKLVYVDRPAATKSQLCSDHIG